MYHVILTVASALLIYLLTLVIAVPAMALDHPFAQAAGLHFNAMPGRSLIPALIAQTEIVDSSTVSAKTTSVKKHVPFDVNDISFLWPVPGSGQFSTSQMVKPISRSGCNLGKISLLPQFLINPTSAVSYIGVAEKTLCMTLRTND